MAITLMQVAQAIEAARSAVPGSRILIREHCHGYDWLLDDAHSIVYLAGDLAPEDAADALVEAVDALLASAARTGWKPKLQLVTARPGGVDERDVLLNLG